MPRNDEKYDTVIEKGVFYAYSFMKNATISKISQFLRIDGWHPVAQVLCYESLFGVILLILTFFILPWTVMWIYVVFCIILSGFLFAKPGSNYHYTLVLGIFVVLSFIPSTPGQTAALFIDGSFTQQEYEIIYDGNSNSTTFEFSNLWGEIKNLQETPFTLEKISSFFESFFDIINWILFLFCVAMVGVAIGQAYTIQFEKAAQSVAAVALAVTFMVGMYTMMDLVGAKPKTIWETIGDSWTFFLKSIGLAQLNVSGDYEVRGTTITLGLMNWVPLMTIIINFALGFTLRHKAIRTIALMKDVRTDYYVSLERTKFSRTVLLMMIVLLGGLIGYFLTKSNVLGADSSVQLIFALTSMVVLLLMGMKIIVINRSQALWSTIKSFLIWTIYGLMLLFFWFNIIQPVCYQLNLIDYRSSLLFMSQENSNVFETNYFEQFFTVAAPETLYFQIAAIGTSNYVLVLVSKGRRAQEAVQRLESEKSILFDSYKKIPITNSTSKENIRNIARSIIIKRQMDEIRLKIKEKQVLSIPFSDMLKSSVIGAVIGSFCFSWWHAFRRLGADINSFVIWWQNPMLGLTFFGAGMVLSLVAIFSWPAAIIVHYFNNILAIIMSGG